MYVIGEGVPLYVQIRKIIKSKILSGEFKQNECMPSELELCTQHNVSRGTLRQALSSLLREGLITRVPGKGTFISDRVDVRRFAYRGSIENLIEASAQGQMRVLDYRPVPLTTRVKQLLEIEEVNAEEKVFRLDLIFSTSRGPSRYSEIYFPASLGEKIEASELAGGRDIILLVEEKLQTRLQRAVQTMDAILLDETVSKHLSMKKGSAVFLIQRQYIARDLSPVFVSFNYCRPDLYEFRCELTRT